MLGIETIHSDCVGCGACADVCPQKCISMRPDEVGFLYPTVDSTVCIKCHRCDRVCQILSDNYQGKISRSYYAAYCSDDKMNPNSTSGGIATAISEWFAKDGFVCASELTDEKKVKHSFTNDVRMVGMFAGSKYVQSDTRGVFIKSKEILDSGTKLLFIGTSCQVSALYHFLGKEYSNLFTVDFMCHGVPSPLAWEKYVKYLEYKHKSKITEYNFRAKVPCWGTMGQSYVFENGKKCTEQASLNAFHCWFGAHLSMRDSCFSCKYRKEERVSDITVADFWKIENYYPDIPTKQGVSAVTVNTDKGNWLWTQLVENGNFVVREVTKESIYEHRSVALHNYKIPERREAFMQDVATLSPKELVKKHSISTPKRLLLSIKSRIKRLVKK